MSTEPGRVYLHIGVPKSGTSFLQAALRGNAQRLRAQGVAYPTHAHHGLFHAALELTGNHPGWGVPQSRVEGSWAELCAAARAHRGTTVLSNELFSNIEHDAVGPTLAELDGLEVHVVVTARDLARQLPAEWQEGVKHGRGLRFDAFLRRVTDASRSHRHAQKFWRHQDLPAILDRWAAHLPPGRVHVVTCPPPGAPRELLWERFCSVTGIDPGATALPKAGANTSLGVTAIDVLRRVNRRIGPAADEPPKLRRVIKQSVVNGALRSDESPRVSVPDAILPELGKITEEWTERITKAGYDVVGDLADLTPRPGSGAPAGHTVAPRHARDLAVDAVAELAREVARLGEELRKAERRADRAERAQGPAQALLRRLLARRD